MLIQKKIGTIDSMTTGRTIDWLSLEWFELNKRILRKKTGLGRDVSLKFMNESPRLTQGDVLYEDNESIIAVEVIPCDCIVLQPANMFEMASVCYEIGNKHLPLFFEDDNLLVPFEQPLFRLLSAQGYILRKETRKLLQPLLTTVSPHGHSGESLFSRIMKLTASDE